MQKKDQGILIPKEEAVFWMDEKGYWHNSQGRIEHPKIVSKFNSSIQKDQGGYFLFQDRPDLGTWEKVYFTYPDTPIFVQDLKNEKDQIWVRLNTGEKKPLNPEGLFMQGDNLYLQTREHKIKFTPRALIKISKFLNFRDQKAWFEYNGKRYKILNLKLEQEDK